MLLTDPEQRRALALSVLPPLGVVLTPPFLEVLIPRPKEKLVSGGWQAGKSFEGAAELYLDLCVVLPYLAAGEVARYWVVVPSYQAPHKEMDYLKEWCQKSRWPMYSHFPDGQSCIISLWGGRVIIETRTAKDVAGIAGEACRGVLVVEAGQDPESVRTQCQGRVVTLDGWITYTGTLEDDEARPRWVWFGACASTWRDAPSADHAAYALPMWSNPVFLPQAEHHPEIERLRRELDEHTFNRRVAGISSGAQFPVYPELMAFGEMPPAPEPIPLEIVQAFGYQVSRDTSWYYPLGAGGHDYGDTVLHPSTLAALTVTTETQIAVVREVWIKRTGDTKEITGQRNRLTNFYRIDADRWGFDPVQREAAKLAGALAVKTGAGSRGVRVGYVQGRIERRTLLWAFDGPGVREAFAQGQRVHYIKRMVPGMGEQFVYNRADDDAMAAVEDATEVIETIPIRLRRPPIDIVPLPGRRRPLAPSSRRERL